MAEFLHPDPGFVSIPSRYLRFYSVSDDLKCFVWHRRSKCGNFELGLLVVSCLFCRWVLCEVTVICLDTVIVETDFEVLKVFRDIPAQVELWPLEVRHTCVRPKDHVMKVSWFKAQQLSSKGFAC